MNGVIRLLTHNFTINLAEVFLIAEVIVELFLRVLDLKICLTV